MRRLLIITRFVALAVCLFPALAGAQFRGVDSKAKVHRPEPVRFVFSASGTPGASQIFPAQCLDNITFPANFVNGFPDAPASASCGSNPTANNTYTFKIAGTTIGTVVLTGSSGATFIQQAAGQSGTATVSAAMGSNVSQNNYIVVFYGEESQSFNPTFSQSAGTAVLSSFTTCPVGAPIQDSSGNASSQLAFAKVTTAGSLTVLATLGGAEVHNLTVAEFSGLAGSSVQDACGAGATSSNTPGTALSTGATGATAVADLIVGVLAQHSNSATFSAFGSFTALTGNQQAGETMYGAYFPTGSAPTSYTLTATSNTSGTWSGVAMALKLAGGTGPGCAATFATTNGVQQTCLAGQRFEMDAPATPSGADIVIGVPGHVP